MEGMTEMVGKVGGGTTSGEGVGEEEVNGLSDVLLSPHRMHSISASHPAPVTAPLTFSPQRCRGSDAAVLCRQTRGQRRALHGKFVGMTPPASSAFSLLACGRTAPCPQTLPTSQNQNGVSAQTHTKTPECGSMALISR